LFCFYCENDNENTEYKINLTLLL